MFIQSLERVKKELPVNRIEDKMLVLNSFYLRRGFSSLQKKNGILLNHNTVCMKEEESPDAKFIFYWGTSHDEGKESAYFFKIQLSVYYQVLELSIDLGDYSGFIFSIAEKEDGKYKPTRTMRNYLIKTAATLYYSDRTNQLWSFLCPSDPDFEYEDDIPRSKLFGFLYHIYFDISESGDKRLYTVMRLHDGENILSQSVLSQCKRLVNAGCVICNEIQTNGKQAALNSLGTSCLDLFTQSMLTGLGTIASVYRNEIFDKIKSDISAGKFR